MLPPAGEMENIISLIIFWAIGFRISLHKVALSCFLAPEEGRAAQLPDTGGALVARC